MQKRKTKAKAANKLLQKSRPKVRSIGPGVRGHFTRDFHRECAIKSLFGESVEETPGSPPFLVSFRHWGGFKATCLDREKSAAVALYAVNPSSSATKGQNDQFGRATHRPKGEGTCPRSIQTCEGGCPRLSSGSVPSLLSQRVNGVERHPRDIRNFGGCHAHGSAWACLRTSNGFARPRKAALSYPHFLWPSCRPSMRSRSLETPRQRVIQPGRPSPLRPRNPPRPARRRMNSSTVQLAGVQRCMYFGDLEAVY